MVKTVLQTDRDGRHDKLKHLVIKSKCSQERFQAKQSWEKLLSFSPPDFVLYVEFFCFYYHLNLIASAKTHWRDSNNPKQKWRTWILFLSASLSYYPSHVGLVGHIAVDYHHSSVPGVLVSWPEGRQGRHHHIILLIVNRFLALSCLLLSGPQVSGQYWTIRKCLENCSIPLPRNY